MGSPAWARVAARPAAPETQDLGRSCPPVPLVRRSSSRVQRLRIPRAIHQEPLDLFQAGEGAGRVGAVVPDARPAQAGRAVGRLAGRCRHRRHARKSPRSGIRGRHSTSAACPVTTTAISSVAHMLGFIRPDPSDPPAHGPGQRGKRPIERGHVPLSCPALPPYASISATLPPGALRTGVYRSGESGT